MAQTVTVPLVVPYRFHAALEKRLRDFDGRRKAAETAALKSGEPAAIVRTYDEQSRDITEQIIDLAVAHVYGDNMPRTERGIWRRIQDQLIDDAHELTMDGTTWTWFRDTMKHDKVKVAPADVSKHETFLESLAAVVVAEPEQG